MESQGQRDDEDDSTVLQRNGEMWKNWNARVYFWLSISLLILFY